MFGGTLIDLIDERAIRHKEEKMPFTGYTPDLAAVVATPGIVGWFKRLFKKEVAREK